MLHLPHAQPQLALGDHSFAKSRRRRDAVLGDLQLSEEFGTLADYFGNEVADGEQLYAGLKPILYGDCIGQSYIRRDNYVLGIRIGRWNYYAFFE